MSTIEYDALDLRLMAEDHADSTAIYGNPKTKDKGIENGQRTNGFPLKGSVIVNGSANGSTEVATEAAAIGKSVLLRGVARAKIGALTRSKQGQGPRQSGE